MRVATFGSTTGWQGKTIDFDGSAFVLEEHGPVTAAEVLTYDKQGHLLWASAEARTLVQQASSRQEATADEASLASASDVRADNGGPAPDWYPDPQYPGNLRYWDGQRWTEHRTPVAASTAALPTRMGDDPLLRWVLPVGRSGWAIAAGYLAFFSVLLLPAPLALATGIVGIVVIKRHPSKHGMGRAIFGVVMGALGTAALCALLLFSGH